MNFLLLLVIYIMQRRFDIPFSRVFDRQFDRIWQRRHWNNRNTAFSGVVLRGVVPLGLICLLLYGVLESIRYQYFGLGYFFAEFLILFFLLGDSGFKEQIAQFLASVEKGDLTGAHHILSACYPTEAVYRVDSPEALRFQACHWVIEESFRRYFLIIFWFALFGAPGALFVRLLERCEANRQQNAQQAVIKMLFECVALPPSRLLALSFALTGNFSTCYRIALERALDFSIGWADFLHRTAQGALNLCNLGGAPVANSASSAKTASVSNISATNIASAARADFPQSKQTTSALMALRELLSRSLGVWFMLLALFALAGWM